MTSAPVIPDDSPSIFDQLTTLDRAAIVRPNNPPRGIAGFLFHYDQEQFLDLVASITDNPVEDGTNLQDNITLMPEIVTLKGIIAELTNAATLDDQPAPTPAPLPLFPGLFPPFTPGANVSFQAKLGAFGVDAGVSIGPGGIVASAAVSTGAIGPFSADSIVRTVTGELAGVIPVSAAIQAAINAAVNNAVQTLSGGNAPSSAAISAAIISAVGNVIGGPLTPDQQTLVTQSVNSSLSTTSGTNPGPTAGAADSLYQYYANRAQTQPGQTAQGLAVQYFIQMWLARQTFSVETPWGIMNSMAIQSCRFEQPEETEDASNFTVVFKKIRIAQSTTVNLGQLAGRNAFQASADTPANNGKSGQTPATPAQEETWLQTLLGGQ